MRQVSWYNLWIGHGGDVANIPMVRDAAIGAFVDVAVNEAPKPVWREAAYLRFPLVDGAGNPVWLLRAAVGAVAELVRAETRTLVFCGAGMSRSPSIAAAGLAMATGRAAGECLRLTTAGCGDVSPRLWAEVLAACGL